MILKAVEAKGSKKNRMLAQIKIQLLHMEVFLDAVVFIRTHVPVKPRFSKHAGAYELGCWAPFRI